MRGILILCALVACNHDRPIPSADTDLGARDLAGVDLSVPPLAVCGATSCGASQVCVVPTCCVECVDYMTQTDAGGICPPGTVENGYCSNIHGPCSIPCTADPPFCVDAPAGCSALDPLQYCSGQGQEGGFCSDQSLHCIECY